MLNTAHQLTIAVLARSMAAELIDALTANAENPDQWALRMLLGKHENVEIQAGPKG